jgi:hypothetical protein
MLSDPRQQQLLKTTKTRHMKYHNTITRLANGMTFHSKAEAARWIVLAKRQKNKEIFALKRQLKYTFKCGITYIADFCYCVPTVGDNWRSVTEDVKGVETEAFKIKAALMAHEFKPVQIIKVNSAEADAVVAAFNAEWEASHGKRVQNQRAKVQPVAGRSAGASKARSGHQRRH